MDGASCTFNASMGGSDTCSAFAVGPAVHFPFPLNAKGRCPLESRRGDAPDPEMLTHLCFACGRDGGLGAGFIADALLTSLPKGGQAGRSRALEYLFSLISKYRIISH